MMETTKQAALARARREARGLQRAGDRRDAAIVAAAEVASMREVAEATGLSKSRIQKIVEDSRHPAMRG